MAGRGLGTLTLDLVAKTGGFTGPLDKAGRDLDRRAKAMQKTATQIGQAMGVALVAGATAFGFAVKAAIDQADQLSKISKKIGIPTDVLSGLNYAAKLADVATEELQAGLVKMVKFQADAAKGAKEASLVFSTLGIAIKDASGNLRGTEAVFKDFAEIFKRLPDGPEKTALAVKVFGRAGAELIPLLNEGKAGLASFADELDKLGGTVTPEAGRAAEQFNDDLERLKTAVGGVALQVAMDLLPELNKLTGSLVENAKEGGAVAHVADAITAGFKHMAEAAAEGVRFVQGLTSTAIGLYGILAKISALNPGVVIAKLFGAGPSANSGVAFDQAMEAFTGGPRAATPTRSRVGVRGGRGMGADMGVPPDISALFEEAAKGAKKTKEEVDKVAEAYKRMNQQMAETIALYYDKSEVAKVSLEIQQLELETGRKMGEAEKQTLLAQAQRLDQMGADKKAREEMIRLEEKETEAAAEHAKQIKELLEDIAFETSLTAMSNDEKERAIILRNSLAGATAEEAKQITAAVDNMLAAQKSAGELSSAMDEFRGNFEDTVVDVVTGAKSISEAFKSLADMVIAQIARIIAQQLTASLFGAPGSTGGGSAGGWLSSLFGMFLGGGSSSPSGGGVGIGGSLAFASGGNPPVGVPYLVGENGPELHIDRTPSTIVPNGKFGGASITVNINGGTNPRETAQQTANEVRRVLAFSGRSG